jgi:hypothetical protein
VTRTANGTRSKMPSALTHYQRKLLCESKNCRAKDCAPGSGDNQEIQAVVPRQPRLFF